MKLDLAPISPMAWFRKALLRQLRVKFEESEGHGFLLVASSLGSGDLARLERLWKSGWRPRPGEWTWVRI